jgi:hypothetical protein
MITTGAAGRLQVGCVWRPTGWDCISASILFRARVATPPTRVEGVGSATAHMRFLYVSIIASESVSVVGHSLATLVVLHIRHLKSSSKNS